MFSKVVGNSLLRISPQNGQLIGVFIESLVTKFILIGKIYQLLGNRARDRATGDLAPAEADVDRDRIGDLVLVKLHRGLHGAGVLDV